MPFTPFKPHPKGEKQPAKNRKQQIAQVLAEKKKGDPSAAPLKGLKASLKPKLDE